MPVADFIREDLIPSYVQDRNAAARRAGLAVHVAIGERKHLVSTWRGTAEQFKASGMRIKVPPAITYQRWVRSPYIGGLYLRREGNDYVADIGDDLPVSQTLRNRDLRNYLAEG